MSISILSGRFARRRLLVPKGEHIRPSTSQLRAALCNILYHRSVSLAQSRVLDLFAGSGSLGFELLSAGATHVDFVEHHPLSLAALRHNQRALQVEAETAIYAEDVFLFLSRAFSISRMGAQNPAQNRPSRPSLCTPYTFILADPPYVKDVTPSPHKQASLPDFAHTPLARLLAFFDCAPHILEPGGLIIFEQAQRDPTPLSATHLRCIDSRTYGDSRLLFWERA